MSTDLVLVKQHDTIELVLYMGKMFDNYTKHYLNKLNKKQSVSKL